MEIAKADSNKLTMTLPRAVMAALAAAGEPLEMTGQEYLKHQVIAALTQREGVLLNLTAAPRDRAPGHPELGLALEGGAAHASAH